MKCDPSGPGDTAGWGSGLETQARGASGSWDVDQNL